MTTEEMLARIAELEKENEKLRRGKDKKPPLFSEKLIAEYPWIKRARYRASADSNLSKLVRSICFPNVKKPHMHDYKNGIKKRIGYDYVLTLAEMDGEQLNLYYEIVEKVVKVLSEYEIISKEDTQ